jgi:hypothetical protein
LILNPVNLSNLKLAQRKKLMNKILSSGVNISFNLIVNIFTHNTEIKSSPLVFLLLSYYFNSCVLTGQNKVENALSSINLYFDTIKNQVFFWNGSAWGNNFYTTGTTANRPVNPVINTLYFDTDISCFIRYDSQGWTTLDGHFGDIKIVDYPDMTDALLMNPGWAEFTAMSSKVPLGQNNGTYGPQDEGNFTFVTSVTPTTDLQYKAMIFLRKEF